mgnify:CR=1 FL=1
MAVNKTTFWGFGDSNDVALSYEDYYSVTEQLVDAKLTPKGLMRFKNLAEINKSGVIAALMYCIPPALAATYFLGGKARRSHSGYRYQWSYFVITYPLVAWVGMTTPIPRRLYTELLADPGYDGAYIRARVKQNTPGLWRKLSHQLWEKGYRFPECNEYTDTIHFPTDFVNRHSK